MFVKYCIVGFLGVFVHTGAYYFFSRIIEHSVTEVTTAHFALSVVFAVETAILFNFILNNEWTFVRDRLRGIKALTGFIRYNFACVFGALANLAVSTFLFSHGFPEIASVIIGACTGVVWNYTMSRLLTWHVTRE
jgi:putative flippase GtrA